MSWNWHCLPDLIGFCPVTINIGMPPSWAYAAAVTKLVAQDRALPGKRPPGPSSGRGRGHEASCLFMASQHQFDGRVTRRVEHREILLTRNAKDVTHALRL